MTIIKDIIIMQKRELDSVLKKKYIKRFIEMKNLKSNLIKVIIGPRRAGKSFLAIHIIDDLKEYGYVNFDDERLVEVKEYDEIISALNIVYGKPKNLLFDEIQNLSKWELFVNRLQRQGYNIIITGSNSKLLSRELSTHLTGRHIPFHLYPLSFKEIIDKELTTLEISEILDKYLRLGGYPEPFVNDLDYRQYLSTLFDSIIYKDIVKRYRIRSPQIIEKMSSYLLSNISKEYSYNSIGKIMGFKSVKTVEKYINLLDESFVFFTLRKFSYKLKEQLSSNKKIYCIDNGFVHSKAFTTSPDFGKLMENLVAVELLRRGDEFYFWKGRDQNEVDFLIKKRNTVNSLIQVCYDLSDEKTRLREMRSLLIAGEELKCKNLILINNSVEKVETFEWFGMRGRIKFVQLQKWLLE